MALKVPRSDGDEIRVDSLPAGTAVASGAPARALQHLLTTERASRPAARSVRGLPEAATFSGVAKSRSKRAGVLLQHGGALLAGRELLRLDPASQEVRHRLSAQLTHGRTVVLSPPG